MKQVCNDTSGQLVEQLSGVAELNAQAEQALAKYRRQPNKNKQSKNEDENDDNEGNEDEFFEWEEDDELDEEK